MKTGMFNEGACGIEQIIFLGTITHEAGTESTKLDNALPAGFKVTKFVIDVKEAFTASTTMTSETRPQRRSMRVQRMWQQQAYIRGQVRGCWNGGCRCLRCIERRGDGRQRRHLRLCSKGGSVREAETWRIDRG